MKKHLLPAVMLATLVAATAAPALAHEGTLVLEASAAVRAGLKGDRQDFREEKKEDRKEFREDQASKSREFRAEAKERMSELRKQRVKAWWNRASRRLSAVIERQRKLAARIEVRIDRLEKAGHDMGDEHAALVAARAKIDVAATSLTEANAKVDGILADNTPMEAFRKLHELHKSVIANIRAAHQALVRVLLSLRAEVGVDVKAGVQSGQ